MNDRTDAQDRAYREGLARFHAEEQLTLPPEHLTAAAIVSCQLCDDEGYRDAVVCDHRQHASEEVRRAARARVAETLARRAAETRDRLRIDGGR